MSEMLHQNPEDYLLDTLYNFQAYREIRGVELEPAVINTDLYEECSVFTDNNSGDRIVITGLPADTNDFTGLEFGYQIQTKVLRFVQINGRLAQKMWFFG